MTRHKYDIDDYNIDLQNTEESLDSHIVLTNNSHIIQYDSSDDSISNLRSSLLLKEKAEELYSSLRDYIFYNSLPLFDNANLDSWFSFLQENTSIRFDD
jgi:hypothetical protein